MEPYFSDSWYRVAALRPRLRDQGRIHRHHYRGRLWYVLENPSDRRVHRLDPGTYALISLMDGHRTVAEIWEQANAQLGEDAPSQDDLIRLLGDLDQADVLCCDVSPGSDQIERARDAIARRRWYQVLLSPLMWRVPLLDPEPWLGKLAGHVRPLFGLRSLVVWTAVVVVGGALACLRWQDLTENLADRVLAPQNLLALWLLFPLFKALHELGHAFAVKAFGGEVHEMGILFLVLSPIPYVDASAASVLPRKRERIVVGAAGMMVEMFIAALALFLWTMVEPGLLRALLFNVIFLAGVSTLLFNANPLLRFDGYYMLADAIEIPNLARRGKAYLGYLCERYLLGNRLRSAPLETPGERIWLVGHGIGSVCYRLIIMIGIALFVSGKFFGVGLLLALWVIVAGVAFPVVRGIHHVCTAPALGEVRRRAVAVTGGLAVAGIGLVCLVPAPLRSQAEGVVWAPEESVVRAGTDGFVRRLLVQPGTHVERGAPLFLCEDRLLASQVSALKAEVEELRARRDAQWIVDRVAAKLLEEEIDRALERLAAEQTRFAELTISSPSSGTLIVPGAADLPGRFVRKGEPVAHVLDPGHALVRVAVPQGNVDLLRRHNRKVRVRSAEQVGTTILAQVHRAIPGASRELPSVALGTRGGGRIPVEPDDEGGRKALEKVFQFDLRLAPGHALPHLGERVFVRFEHGWEPMALRWYRDLKRLFLEKSGA